VPSPSEAIAASRHEARADIPPVPQRAAPPFDIPPRSILLSIELFSAFFEKGLTKADFRIIIKKYLQYHFTRRIVAL
jgi:hypothetical protein